MTTTADKKPFLPNGPIAIVFADPDFFGLALIELLRNKNCQVVVISKNNSFSAKLSQKGDSSTLVKDKGNCDQLKSAKYLIFINNYLTRSLTELSQALELTKSLKLKTLFIMPFSVETLEQKRQVELHSIEVKKAKVGIKTVFVGDILEPKITSHSYYLPTLLANISRGIPLVPLKQEVAYYPLTISHLCEQIVRTLFSFGPGEKRIAIIGKTVSSNVLIHLITSQGNLQVSSQTKGLSREEVLVDEKKYLASDLTEIISSALKTAKSSQNEVLREAKTKKANIPQKKSTFLKKQILIFLLVASLALSPFIFLLAGGSLLVLGKNSLEEGKLKQANNLFFVAKKSVLISDMGVKAVYTLPVINHSKNKLLGFSQVLNKSADLGLTISAVMEKSEILFKNVVGKDSFDLAEESREITLGLDEIYKKISFLEGDISSLSGLAEKITAQYINKEEINSQKNQLLLASRFISQLPVILGIDSAKNYLILFQNNMELRPTGGFIGSFAVVSFDKGRLVDLSIQDVYSADGQLKGHVEPPEPIRVYLNEANWFLRDSNWDPDFPTSASRAEWFLEKEIDKQVDGVVAVDLEVTRGLLRAVGPIYLGDFNQQIDEKNLYEKTQYEVERNFFPGSTKKQTFITALSRELINKIIELPSRQVSAVIETLFSNLEERHIQISLHNPLAQKQISALRYDGSILRPTCSQNCFLDWLGIAEANLGVNKSNYFLKRSLNLDASLNKETRFFNLTVNYENLANPSLGESVIHKTYLRLMLPLEANLKNVLVQDAAGSSQVDFKINQIGERKEIGLFLVLAPGEKKKVHFSWEPKSENLNNKEYVLYVRKQAGTVSDPLSVKFHFPVGAGVLPMNPPSLTSAGSYVYNTDLRRDFISRFIWKSTP